MQVYPAPEYVEAIRSRAWSLLAGPLNLKTCQQVLSEEGPFPQELPMSDHYPFLGIVSNGWEGDKGDGMPNVTGALSFTLVYLKQYALPDPEADTPIPDLNEHELAQSLDADLREIAKPFSLADFSLPGFSPPTRYRHKRIHPVDIRPTIDLEIAEFSTRLIGGIVQLRATGDSFEVSP